MGAAPNLGPDCGRVFNAMDSALGRLRGVPLDPFFLDGVAGRRTLIQADGLHPNAAGVAAIVGRMAPTVRAALRSGSIGRAGA